MKDELLNRALNLPKEDRIELMRQLLQSLKTNEDEDASPERLNILRERFEDIEDQVLFTFDEVEAYIKGGR